MKNRLQIIMAVIGIVGFVVAGCSSDGGGSSSSKTDTGTTTSKDAVAGDTNVAKTDPGAAKTDPGAAKTDPGAAKTDPGAQSDPGGGSDTTIPEDEGGTDPGAQPSGACTNAADGAILQTVDAAGEAGTCGLQCLADADPVACSGKCVKDATGLSSECSQCFANTVGCAITNCLAQCAADPESQACDDCQATAGCTQAFYDCSGLTPPAE